MRVSIRGCALVLSCTLLATLFVACVSGDSHGGGASSRNGRSTADRVIGSERMRFATFNAYLNRPNAGDLARELRTKDSEQAKAVAEILQRVRPDVVLLNEFDWDVEAIQLFRENYLAVPHQGAQAIHYPHVFVAPSNTGVDSGFDLDNDGRQGRAGDALGFGRFPGQYGMALLSRFPIDPKRSRTFQKFLWKDMPGALLPEGFYAEDELAVLPLSSKSHWDVVVLIDDTPVHILCAHPTPPVFDGEEDRNGRRNRDEIRLFADYISPGKSDYIVDDAGHRGGLEKGAHFVILGDYNADPHDGDHRDDPIRQFLDHPAIRKVEAPASAGGVDASKHQGGVNRDHKGDPAHDTCDFADERAGNMRLDYALPSKSFRVLDSGVFWPARTDPLFRLVGDGEKVISSDHRLVWIDVDIE